MTFTNLQLDEASLPAAADLAFRPMVRAYVVSVRLVQWLTWGTIVLLAALPSLLVAKPLSVKAGLLALPAGLALLGIVVGWFAIRGAAVKGYALREHDLALRTGVYFRKTVILPLDRVQHAEVSDGPIQRRFGLATLKLYTAGGTSVDLQIDGLPKTQAEALRGHVLERAGRRG